MRYCVCLLVLTGLTLTLSACESAKLRTGVMQTDDQVPMVYDTRGRGEPALVFVHCWSCDRDFWKNQVNEFAADHRVVTFDLPGHGESGHTRAEWKIETYGRDVAKLVKKLDLDDVILIGHSMGGPVALAAAGRLQGRVIGVILVDTVQNAEFQFPRPVAESFADSWASDYEGMLNQFVPAMFAPETDKSLPAWVEDRARTTYRPAAVALMRDFANVDNTKLMKNAGVPIRAINAEMTEAQMPTEFEINRKYADFDAVIIEDVGHYVQLEKPQEFNNHLREYIRELSGE